MTTRNQWLATGLVWIGVTFAGCGGHTDPDAAMKAKDYAEAAVLYEAQMATAKPVEDAWLRAATKRIEALAYTDKARAGSEANALVAQYGQQLGDKKVSSVALALKDGGAFTQAITLLNDTVKTWPVSSQLDSVHSAVLQEAFESGDTKGLEGIGYVGGGEVKFVPRKGSQTQEN